MSTPNDDLYVLLKGMPFSVTENDISHFFHGLLVDGIILLKNARGQNTGIGLVRFATRKDARDGLKRDRDYIGSRFVEVYTSSEEQWCENGGNVAICGNDNGKFGRGKSPIRTQRNPQHRARSRSPLAPRTNSTSNEEFCVMLENLSYSVEKRSIKELFSNARLQDDQILYLLDGEGKRTRSVFVLFKSLRDYCEALTHHKEEFQNRYVYISPITREKMISVLESPNMKDGPPGRTGRFQEGPSSQQGDPYDSEKVCLYVRNMPFDVRKVEIMDFFIGFNITEDRVVLLRDPKGAGLGEALVVCRSEGEAMSAQSLNGQRFLGSEVMLKCISRSQMQEFGVEPPAVQQPVLREERCSARSSEGSYHPGDMEYSDLRITPDRKMPMSNLQIHIHGGSGYDPYAVGSCASQDGGGINRH
ncbi:RNA binding motif protein 12Bb [Diretmus argenteus]